MAEATPTLNSLPLRKADFATLAEALDYAAEGETGYNFYSGGGELCEVLPYKKLCQEAIILAHRLLGLDLERGDRIALIADTDPDFLRSFYACQYAGVVPVPLPANLRLGGHKAYVEHLRRLLENCHPPAAMAPKGLLPFLR
jgi:fatty-acyl-CoA synthase